MRIPMTIATAALVACAGRVDVTPLNNPPRPMPPRAVGDVQIFTTAPPAFPYTEIASLEIAAGGFVRDLPGKLRARAAEMGCDGLLYWPRPGGAGGTCIQWLRAE